MLNHPPLQIPFQMAPSGSLNSLPVDSDFLHSRDPLCGQSLTTGSTLVSRRALKALLVQCNHRSQGDLRAFIADFDEHHSEDARLLTLICRRLSSVIRTARLGRHWQHGDTFAQRLAQHWQAMQTLVLSGGLTSPPFGPALAAALENELGDISVIASPWGGQTALIGMAETIAPNEDLAVFDFGSTNIKRGIAHRLGNRIDVLPDIKLAPYLSDGKLRAVGLQQILNDSRPLFRERLPVAISMAVYLNDGHPYNYSTGKYQDLRLDCANLEHTLAERWLPQAGYDALRLLAHDSTAAALAFRFTQPAMMVTLGTGLGSAPCPIG